MTLNDPIHTIGCPRCGYDQRGVVATWTETCPLSGICTECGLDINWSEVLCPEKYEPHWCIEFEPRRSRLPLAVIRTMVRSCRPWRFWTRLRMSNPIRWPRLFAYLLLMTLPLLMVYVVVMGSLALAARQAVQQEIMARTTSLPIHIRNYQRMRAQWAKRIETGEMDFPGQYNERNLQMIDAEIATMQGLLANPESIDLPAWRTTIEAIITPWLSWSQASIVSPNGVTRAYPAPIEIPQLALEAWDRLVGGQGRTDSWYQSLNFIGTWLLWGAAMSVSLPLSFLLLPFTLREAKIRHVHLVRIFIYSLAIPLACTILIPTLITLMVFVIESRPLFEISMKAVPYATWLPVAVWWHAAASRYLRIRHAWFVIASLTLMCLLLQLAIVASFSFRAAWIMQEALFPIGI